MKKEGFTLIETIFYTAIIAVVSIVIVGAILTMATTFYNLRVSKNLNSAAISSIERMAREIKASESVGMASVFDSSPGYLKLNAIDINGNPKTTEFLLEDGSLKIKNNGGTAEILTPQNINVSNLIFRQVVASSTIKAVKMEIEFRATLNNNSQKIEKFYDTALLRASGL